MADGYVRVSPDSSGKKVETKEFTRQSSDSGATTAYETVERQTVDIPGTVTVDGEMLRHLVVELRLISLLLQQALTARQDDLDGLRGEIAINLA